MIEIQTYDKLRCPECKSKNLNFDSYEPIDELFKQNATCQDCGFEMVFWADKPKYWEVNSKEE